jgi:hypothetical protein
MDAAAGFEVGVGHSDLQLVKGQKLNFCPLDFFVIIISVITVRHSENPAICLRGRNLGATLTYGCFKPNHACNSQDTQWRRL